MTLIKENDHLKKKLIKKQAKINNLINNSKIQWKKHFFKLLLASSIVILILLLT